MTRQQTTKTISREDTLKRVNTVRYVFLAALMTVPILGMLIGAFLAIRTVAIIFARSGQFAKDLGLAVGTVVVGFAGMFAAAVWGLMSGHGVLALIADFLLNFWILRGVVFGRLAHIYTASATLAGI